MTTIALIALLVAAVGGTAFGARHLYLRLDRPGGFDCSVRVVHGTMPGLGPKFRAGYAGPEPHHLFWRRLAWPGVGVRIPVERVRIDRERRPRPAERIGIPAAFGILPVELADGTQLELALARRRIPRLVALLD